MAARCGLVAGAERVLLEAAGLTSVDQAGRHISAEAARLLLDRIDNRQRPSAQVKLSPTLVPRRTTAPPAVMTRPATHVAPPSAPHEPRHLA
jgi:hypothetical protein